MENIAKLKFFVTQNVYRPRFGCSTSVCGRVTSLDGAGLRCDFQSDLSTSVDGRLGAAKEFNAPAMSVFVRVEGDLTNYGTIM